MIDLEEVVDYCKKNQGAEVKERLVYLVKRELMEILDNYKSGKESMPISKILDIWETYRRVII